MKRAASAGRSVKAAEAEARAPTKGDRTKASMVEAAGEIARRRGYEAAGVREILERSGAPRGSFYFHFPDGREALLREGIAATAAQWKAALEAALDSVDALDEAMRATCELLARSLLASGYRDGCPLATVALERSAEDDALQAMLSAHFREWEATIAKRVRAEGVDAASARGFARFALAAVEGALLLARVHRDVAPLRELPPMLAATLAVVRHAKGRSQR